MFAIALSSTESAIPTARFRIAQYLSGSGSPSSAVFIMRLTYAAASERASPGNAATASTHIESRPSNRPLLQTLTRLAALATLSRGAGEGL